MSIKENVPVGLSINKVFLPHNKLEVEIRIDRLGKHDPILVCRMDTATFGSAIAGVSHVECSAQIRPSTLENADMDEETKVIQLEYFLIPVPNGRKISKIQHRRYCQRIAAMLYIDENELSEQGWFLKHVDDIRSKNTFSLKYFTAVLHRYKPFGEQNA